MDVIVKKKSSNLFEFMCFNIQTNIIKTLWKTPCIYLFMHFHTLLPLTLFYKRLKIAVNILFQVYCPTQKTFGCKMMMPHWYRMISDLTLITSPSLPRKVFIQTDRNSQCSLRPNAPVLKGFVEIYQSITPGDDEQLLWKMIIKTFICFDI